MLLDNVTETNDVQALKAPLPRDLTLSGMVIDFKAEHDENA